MGVCGPLIAGTAISLVVVSAWSYLASLAIGPAAPVQLGPDLASDYAQLAAAPTGNVAELFAAVAAVYALCLLAVGWRQHRWRSGGGG
jgi:hypothetical protein